MIALINCTSSTVKEISKVPAYSLAYLAKEIPAKDNPIFYSEVIRALHYDFPKVHINESLICKRSFTIDTNDLELIRQFVIKHDSQLKRPKSTYIVKLAIAYTLMSFEEGKSESTSVIAPSLNQLELLEKVIALFKESVVTSNPEVIKKIIKLQKILSE